MWSGDFEEGSGGGVAAIRTEDMQSVGVGEDDAEDTVRRRQVIGCHCGETFFGSAKQDFKAKKLNKKHYNKPLNGRF